MRVAAANATWVASCWPEWQRFKKSAKNAESVQTAILSRCLEANKDTEFGTRHRFGSIRTPEDYRVQVPLSEYDDYVEPIDRIARGHLSVLTAEPVRMFELSSGSTASSKLIPYTSSLKAEFQRGISPWIFNLYTGMPELAGGQAYWSITPLLEGKRFTQSGIPIGFDADSDYLGMLGKWLVNSVLAVPNAVKEISNIETFRYVTLLHLLRQADLRLISVWNPTYLSLLLDSLSPYWESLLKDISLGTISPPTEYSDLRFQLSPQQKRAQALATISPMEYEKIWPALKLISCWADGPSSLYVDRLRDNFPGTAFQGKGLIATEALVSFPLLGLDGAVLSINSHFYEFIPTEGGEPLLAHQLSKGQSYYVVVTTGGGLYRYQLHDVVRVVGFWEQLPCFQFVSKADHISDWFGEKLDERFVAQIARDIFAEYGIEPIFALLAPEDDPEGFLYVLYLESQFAPEGLAGRLDQALRSNFHYDYCRKLGQLAALRVVQVSNGASNYLRGCEARGQRLGNIKPSILRKETGWSNWLRDN
ncbi:MAG: GH3 auxin-responsive promoter family protein [Anaerolineae bacterium]|nr:MAG: GH3 auxin-responsive promoter family protein [Anaerolineae bacterium]